MKQKLFNFLRPRLALLLAVFLLAGMLPAVPLTAAAVDENAPERTWEERNGIQGESFSNTPTRLTSYTYYDPVTGEETSVPVDPHAEPGSMKNPFSIASEADLILFGKQKTEDTAGKFYILDKEDLVYDMQGDTYSMLPLMATLSSSGTEMMYSDIYFLGVLVGNGATIQNAYIRTSNGLAGSSTIMTHPGLFGGLKGVGNGACQVMDLSVSVTFGPALGNDNVRAGGLAGITEGTVSLQKLDVNVTVTPNPESSSKDYAGIGGLVGEAVDPTMRIRNCKATLSSPDNEELNAPDIGGLVGCFSWSESGSVTLANCEAEIQCAVTGGDLGGLVGEIGEIVQATLTDCTAQVHGALKGENVGGAIGKVNQTAASLTNCETTVTDSMTYRNGEYDDPHRIGALLGALVLGEEPAPTTFTNCTAAVPITKSENDEYYPKGAVGAIDIDGAESSETPAVIYTGGDTVSTLTLGRFISVALVNGTALTEAGSAPLKVSAEASGNGTTGSVTVGSNYTAEINVHGGGALGGKTYSLVDVDGTIRLEDKTAETTPAYWVTADAKFFSTGLGKGDSVNLLGEADNKYCTVTFDSQGGSAVDSVTVASGASLGTQPDDPTQSGHIFAGWYASADGTATWDFSTHITQSMTLYARWNKLYTVTVNGGKVEGDKTEFLQGDVVSIMADQPTGGRKFVNWTAENDAVTFAQADSPSTTFTMPAGNVTVTANFKSPALPPTYTPDVEQTEGGHVTITPKNPRKGDKVTITPEPDAGFEVDKITVTGPDGKPVDVTKNADGTSTFTQPGGKVKIHVAFKPAVEPWENPFTDVRESDWFYDPVRYVHTSGLMNGTGAAAFSPNSTTTRGMIATIFYRLAGSPDIEDEIWGYPYADVDAEAYYGTAVYWARLNGVVNGYSDELFGPNDAVTREQFAAMLYRYAGSPAAADLTLNFADADQVSGYAQDAMRWAVDKGIIKGMGNKTLAPQGKATRAEVAAMIQRFLTAQGE